ncbi:MAG TPA: PLP-dependent aminotransferase family protein [Acidimicrobiales bacterium]|jgi:2-aminoadipate transaminase
MVQTARIPSAGDVSGMTAATTGPITLAAAGRRVTSSAIRDLLTVVERPEVISLAGGLPAAETFPVAEIAGAIAELLATESTRALQYSTTEGYLPLRTMVADWHGTVADQVLMTHGSQQALELVVRATVDPGAEVALADPGYVGAIQAFRLAGARLTAIPTDADGMIVEALAERLAQGCRPVLVYVVPNFHNPTSATLAIDRRRSLGALAERYGFLIVEDDPYGHLRWAGDALPALRSFSGRVVSLGTISKLLCPGLRVGYAVAPPGLAGPLVTLKQAVDLHTSTLGQMTAHRVLATPGFLPGHVDRVRLLYQHRATALAAAVAEHLGAVASFRPAEGGMFLWIRLDRPDVDTHDLLEGAVAAGVAYVPGRAFGIDDRHPHELRLSFSGVPPSDLDEGVRRLAASLLPPGRRYPLNHPAHGGSGARRTDMPDRL